MFLKAKSADEKKIINQKLTRDTLTAAVARFFVRSHISYLTIEHEDFVNLLRLCNPQTQSLLPKADTLGSFIRKNFIGGRLVLKSQLQQINSKIK